MQPSWVTVAKVNASGSRLLTDPVAAELNELIERRWWAPYPALDGDDEGGGAVWRGRQEESGEKLINAESSP